MIDADRTLSVLGVDVSTLTPGSNKKVFRVCESCGKYNTQVYNKAIKNHYCKSCALIGIKKTPKHKKKIGAANKKSIIGQRFGRLIAIKEACERTKNNVILWECVCDCGNVCTIRRGDLVSGATKSCGCLRAEKSYINGKKLSNQQKGENHPFYGKNLNIDHRNKISDSRIRNGVAVGNKNPMYGRSGEDAPSWKGGISFEPYCPKFNEQFKESIREKFGRVCFLCPTTEEENGRKLNVHHVNYNKDCLCDNSECEFVPLCNTCHSKTNHNRKYWETLIMGELNGHS